MFGVFLGLAVAMDYALKRTRWGRSMNAVAVLAIAVIVDSLARQSRISHGRA